MQLEARPVIAAKIRSITSTVDSTEVDYLATSSSCAKELNNLEHMGWIEIKGVMDPRAADSVAHTSVLPQLPIYPSNGSASGQTCLKANGTRLANLEEKRLNVITNDVKEHSVTYQAPDVTRPLTSLENVIDIFEGQC